MTPPSPTEVAALRGRLSRACGKDSTGRPWEHTMLATADLRAALALLDAQAAEIARLTAERERARDVCRAAIKFVDTLAAGCSDKAVERRIQNLTSAVFRLNATDFDRALAPAPAAEVAG